MANPKFKGKNPDFTAEFDPNTQVYTVYKNSKILITGKTKFSQIKSYLN